MKKKWSSKFYYIIQWHHKDEWSIISGPWDTIEKAREQKKAWKIMVKPETLDILFQTQEVVK
jgi:hypothetical protein